MKRSIDILVSFINDHSGCTAIAKNDSTLLVTSGVTTLKDGIWGLEIVTEEIPATMQAVRDWLGY